MVDPSDQDLARDGSPACEAGPARERDAATAAELAHDRPAWQRALWVALGFVFVGIGAVGVVVPGLPTTPLLLLAAACFARSSPRLYAWLLANRTFGPLIADYRAGRGVSLRVKASALTMMAVFVAFALLVPLRGRPWPSLAVLALAVWGAAFIARIPTRVPGQDGSR